MLQSSLPTLCLLCTYIWEFSTFTLVAQMVKNLPAMWENWVWSLGPEDPLEKGMAARSSIFAWRIPWTKDPNGLQSIGLQKVGYNWKTNTHTPSIGLGHRCTCENPTHYLRLSPSQSGGILSKTYIFSPLLLLFPSAPSLHIPSEVSSFEYKPLCLLPILGQESLSNCLSWIGAQNS